MDYYGLDVGRGILLAVAVGAMFWAVVVLAFVVLYI